jgi:hypothetical protein
MDITRANAKRIAYAAILVGCLLAAAGAIEPQFGHYKLMFGTLLLGILPYAVYGGLSDILRPLILAAVGVLILGIDLLARLAGLAHDATGVGRILWGYLPVWLALLPLIALLAGQYSLPEQEHADTQEPPHSD